MRDWEVVSKSTRINRRICLFFKEYLGNTPVSCNTLANFHGLSGKKLEEWYRLHLSGFYAWQDREHAEKWLLFEKSMGSYLSIDETSLSDDGLYQ
jgi:hypothetical protein